MAHFYPRHPRPAGPRLDGSADCFHRIVCPLCNGPMTARVGRNGPYFHCHCREKPKPDEAARKEPRTQ